MDRGTLNETLKTNWPTFVFIAVLLALLIGIGHGIGYYHRLASAERVTTDAARNQRERDVTIGELTETVNGLRQGIERLETELRESEARNSALEKYLRNAGGISQQIIDELGRSRQNIQTAIGIIERYTQPEQTADGDAVGGDSGGGGPGGNGRLAD